MIRNKAVLELDKNGKLYQFLCECDSPLGEAFDALSAFRYEVYKKMQAEMEASTKKEPCQKEACEQAAV